MVKDMDKRPDYHPLSEQAQAQARRRWDGVAKPLHSLGLLEDMITKIAGIQQTADVRLDGRCALVFCADHGVVAEGVSQTGSEVTALVARSIAEGTANINLIARAAAIDVFAVDMGMIADVECEGIIARKQARGTDNMVKGPAMSRAQAEQAVQYGVELVGEMKRRGYRIFVTGEMGIGNTTAASAVACALLGAPVETLVGRGAGLSDAGLARKRRAVQRALEVNRPDADDPMDVLAKVGGYELAGMMGAFLGGMLHRVPVVIDGAISAVSALLAARMRPGAEDYMLASHISREPAAELVLNALGLKPVICADLALGEGTGAAMLLPMLEMALNVYRGTHTFSDLGMKAYTPQEGKP